MDDKTTRGDGTSSERSAEQVQSEVKKRLGVLPFCLLRDEQSRRFDPRRSQLKTCPISLHVFRGLGEGIQRCPSKCSVEGVSGVRGQLLRATAVARAWPS